MEPGAQGEAQGDIFAADAVGFRLSGTYLAVIIGGLVLCGIAYEMCRCRRRYKVENSGKLIHFKGWNFLARFAVFYMMKSLN